MKCDGTCDRVPGLEAQLAEAKALIQLARDGDGQMLGMLNAAEAERDALKAQLAEVQEKNTELEHLFDVQHSRTVVADKMWQEHHGRPHVLPDLGELIEWLMAESIGLVQERDVLRRQLAQVQAGRVPR